MKNYVVLYYKFWIYTAFSMAVNLSTHECVQLFALMDD